MTDQKLVAKHYFSFLVKKFAITPSKLAAVG